MKRIIKLFVCFMLVFVLSGVVIVSANGTLSYTKGVISSNTEVTSTDILGIASLYQSNVSTYNGGIIDANKLDSHDIHWVELNDAVTSGYVKFVQYSRGTTFNWKGMKPSYLGRGYEMDNPTMMVLAGINADFFHINDNCEPLGTAMQDGDFYKPFLNNTAGHQAIGFRTDGTYIYGVPDVSTNEYVKVLGEDENYSTVAEIKNVDGTLSEVGVNLLTRFKVCTSTTSSNSISDKELPYDLTDYKVYTILYSVERYDRETKKVFVKGFIKEVTTGQATYKISDKESTTYLACKDGSLDSLAVGDNIKCECSLQGTWAGVTNIVSSYNQVLKDGKVVDYTGVTDVNTDYVNCAKNRTIMGFKEDGSPVMMVVEKHGYGASYAECGEILKALGCVQGFLFDGGGSADLFIRTEDGKLTPINKQEDGTERSDANAILMVAKNPGYSIDITSNGSDATFSLNVTNEEAFKEVKSVNITFNGQTVNLKDGSYTVKGLKPSTTYSYSESYEITSFVDASKYVTVNKSSVEFATAEYKFVPTIVNFTLSDATANSFKINVEENADAKNLIAHIKIAGSETTLELKELTSLVENLTSSTSYEVYITFKQTNEETSEDVDLQTESKTITTQEASPVTPVEPDEPEEQTKSGCGKASVVIVAALYVLSSGLVLLLKKE